MSKINNFIVKITGEEDLKDGEPDPEPFQPALEKLNLKLLDSIIVENSPSGVKSGIRAGVRFIIILNNTPLDLSDFKDVLPNDENEFNNIEYKNTTLDSKFGSIEAINIFV